MPFMVDAWHFWVLLYAFFNQHDIFLLQKISLFNLGRMFFHNFVELAAIHANF